MSEADPATKLRDAGVVLLRNAFALDSLTKLRDAATRCFEAIEADSLQAERSGFNRFAHSVPVTALLDFGCDAQEAAAPLLAPGLSEWFAEVMGSAWACRMERSWVRKKFAPAHASAYHAQGWHQDGALGVQFPQVAGQATPMTELLTCWIPLQACGLDSPGLEFVCGRQNELLHFTELEDAMLRRRFAAERFWAPQLKLGDGLIFLKSVLHRTHTTEAMGRDRLSVEYRIFPSSRA